MSDLLTVAEAATRLGVSASHLYAAINEERCPVPTLLLGKTRYVPRAALEAHLSGTSDRIDALRGDVAALRDEIGQITAIVVAAATAALAAGNTKLPTSVVGGRELGTFQMEDLHAEPSISGRGRRLRVQDATRRPAYGASRAQPRATRARTAPTCAGATPAKVDGGLPGHPMAAGAGHKADRASGN